MSTAATMSQPPAIPPRPSRSQDRSNQAESQPMIPPRPLKRFDRSVSPNPHRFAPSPLNDNPFPKSPRASRFPDSAHAGPAEDPIQRPGSVNMPSVGEEGHEYEAVREKAPASQRPVSPEQTRMIAEDLKLHAPKPSFPAQSAKQRVSTVTRTDSDKAASFGIGRPSSGELPPSYLKKKRSSIGQGSEAGSIDVFDDEEHGIPEIGQQVPLNPHLGDVQAPSPAPQSHGHESGRSQTPRHHGRKLSARGFPDAPPGSYGLHGHGTPSNDKFERAWYEKHPESKKRESQISLHDRQNDFAMSSTDLNKIVRDTRDSGMGTSVSYTGTPSEEIGYQASEEYTQRMHSRPGSAAPRSPELRRASTPRKDSPAPALGGSVIVDDDGDVIHVDGDHNRSRSFLNSRENLTEDEEAYSTPILAADEVAKNPHHYNMDAAVPAERRGSFLDDESSSRPTSRPSSLYHHGSQSQVELTSTPLEDVVEYEPLFPEEEEQKRKAEAKAGKPRHKFPSKDIWEDAPDSVNATAMVSTPEFEEEEFVSSSHPEVTRTETPAQAFARQQEELAEKESRQSPESYGLRQAHVPRPHPVQRMKSHEARPHSNRFPSRDVWEDTPESLMHETTVDSPDPESTENAEPTDESPTASRPAVPARPQKKFSGDKPAIPERPKPSSSPSDERLRPVVSDKPKPQVPARPTKTLNSGVDSKEQDAAPRQKPAVPARPVGSKIQALQAGFMSDLNKRLQLGPQAPAKKEEPPAADMIEEKEKAPLADARKGRARGPQRRAPAAKSPAPVADLKSGTPTLSFSPLRTCWSIGDDGILEVDNSKPEPKKTAPEPEVEKVEPEPEVVPEVAPAVASEAPKAELASEPETKAAEPAPTAFEAAEKGIDSFVPSEKLEPQAPATSTEQQVEPEVSQPQEAAPEQLEQPTEQLKTLASNTAGEPILEAQIEQTDEVKPVSVQQPGGEAA